MAPDGKWQLLAESLEMLSCPREQLAKGDGISQCRSGASHVLALFMPHEQAGDVLCMMPKGVGSTSSNQIHLAAQMVMGTICLP